MSVVRVFIFFFKQKTAYEVRISDWSSDVCSSDLYARAVERASRSAEAVLQARASGAPVLEHQKVALERTTQALDQIRPGASRDLASAMQRDPALLREAAAGRSGPMIEAMAQEARVRADPNLRADRFVERWQGLKQERDRLDRKSTRLNSSH